MRILVLAMLFGASLFSSPHASAQTSAGTMPYTCSQTGSQIICNIQAIIGVPTGSSLVPGAGQTQINVSATGAVSNPPICTALVSSLASVPVGGITPVTFTLSGCVAPALYTFKWAAPVASATGLTAVHSPNLSSSAPSQTYTVTVCLASNATACSSYSAAVTSQSVGIAALNPCIVVASPTSISIGGTALLSVNCLSGLSAGSGATYLWSRNGANTGITSATYTVAGSDSATTGTSTYSVVIANQAPSVASASTTVVVTGAAVPPSPTDSCASTPVRVNINASEPYRKIYTSDITPNFRAGEDFVVQFDVAPSDTTDNRFLASIEFADFGATRGGRFATFSQSKCDYSATAQWVTPYYFGTKVAVNAGRATVVIGSDPRAGEIRLTPGRWYLNVQNAIGSCPPGISCHAVIEWAN